MKGHMGTVATTFSGDPFKPFKEIGVLLCQSPKVSLGLLQRQTETCDDNVRGPLGRKWLL